MKKIGIGYEDYKRIIDDGCYYVDKTMFIKDIVEKGGMVTLFTRPRRFGKTLALSTLKTFFELEYDFDGNVIDKHHYFDGKQIMSSGDDILSRMGQYPVIHLSLKSAGQQDFETSFFKLRDEIIGEFARHNYLKPTLENNPGKKELFEDIEYGYARWNKKKEKVHTEEERKQALNEEYGKYATSLKALSVFLKEYHKKNVIILLDEYDVPLENAYTRGFYAEMVTFIKSLFESALKTNDALEFSVVTGCLRISKESIFTGLNNLKVNSIRDSEFGEYFGFTQEETTAMLDAYNLSSSVSVVRKWYDGYLFGNIEVYNPWSVISFVDDHKSNPGRLPEPYWANTSSNSIIKTLIERADDSEKEELRSLISGGSIEKIIHEDITYNDVFSSPDNLWNFLFFTGYMKKVSERCEGRKIYITMKIPNEEICSIFENQITEWFNATVKSADSSILHRAINNKDINAIENYVSDLLSKSISYFDGDESFYHGFFLSLLYGMPGYFPRSNREEGNGRPDIVLYPDHPKDPAYIFEIKVRKKFSEMDEGLDEAISQIMSKKYVDGILNDGYASAVSYGICFCKKSCVVRML